MKQATAERIATALANRDSDDYATLADAFVLPLPEYKLTPRPGLALDFWHDWSPTGAGHGVILDVLSLADGAPYVYVVRTATDTEPLWIPVSEDVTVGEGKASHRAGYTPVLSYTPAEHTVRMVNLASVAAKVAEVLTADVDHHDHATDTATEPQLALF